MAKNKQPRATQGQSEQKGQQKTGTNSGQDTKSATHEQENFGYSGQSKKGTQSGQNGNFYQQKAQDTKSDQSGEDCK